MNRVVAESCSTSHGRVVDLSHTQVTDAELKRLAALKNLTTLDLARTRVTGAGLKDLAALKNLAALHLGGTYPILAADVGRKLSLTAADLKELTALKNLTALHLSETDATSLA